MKSFTLALAGALTFALGLSAEVQKKDVDIKAPDGTNLKGSYFSPGRRGPAILLLHQCNMDRHAWDTLANDLAASGFHVLTIDYRGYGDSGGHFANPEERRQIVQGKWPSDVDAAYASAQRLGCEIVHPLTDEPWGVRRFFVRDPSGHVLNVLSHPER